MQVAHAQDHVTHASHGEHSVTSAATRTRQERIDHLLSYIQDESHSRAARYEAAEDLIYIRLDGKRSWKGLGYPHLTDNSIRLMARKNQSGEAEGNKPSPEPEPVIDLQPNAAKIARMFFNQEQWGKLEAHRSRNDTNWDDLDFTDEEIALIESHLTND